MHSVSTVQCELVCFSGGNFANPVVSRLREWRLWRAPIGQPGPGTAAIAPWTSPRHGRYVHCSYVHQVATATPQGLYGWFIHLPPHPQPPPIPLPSRPSAYGPHTLSAQN